MPNYKNGEDIGSFLHQFESKKELARVDKDRWVEYVLEVLDGEAMEACNGISLTEVSYDDLKTALFTYFNVTPENRRAQVRKFKKESTMPPMAYGQEILQDDR